MILAALVIGDWLRVNGEEDEADEMRHKIFDKQNEDGNSNH